MTRRGDWIQTYTSRQFWPLDPRSEDIDIVDISAALANKCRFGGHCLKFYSVAEHCVLMARSAKSAFVSPAEVLWMLLHDAAEAYLPDVPRPVKPYLTGFADLEESIMRAVATRFGLAWPEPEIVKTYDCRILTAEMQQNMAPPPMPWGHPERDNPLDVRLQFWAPPMARSLFISEFALSGGRA